MKTCNCGSGKERYELVDAAGIFCTFVCEDCEEKKMAKYDPVIFESNTIYSCTGEEGDIWLDTSVRDVE